MLEPHEFTDEFPEVLGAALLGNDDSVAPPFVRVLLGNSTYVVSHVHYVAATNLVTITVTPESHEVPRWLDDVRSALGEEITVARPVRSPLYAVRTGRGRVPRRRDANGKFR